MRRREPRGIGRTRHPARLLVASALFAVALYARAAPNTPDLPGKAPQPRAEGYDAAAENQRCEGCHTEIAAEWRGSLHHKSWDDPVFLRAYAIEPDAFCRACHVPEAAAESTPPEAARRLGVGCVTCHAPAGEIVSAHGQTAKDGRHATRGDARLSTASACRGCHQFDFPEPQEAKMQGTIDEHRASLHKAQSCQECHMPLVSSPGGSKHKNHDFRVIGNAAMLRSAIVARASRESDTEVIVSLKAGRVGHDVPTGDMFRRLEIRAWVVEKAVENGNAQGTQRAARPVVLARRFVMVPRGHGTFGNRRMQVGDDRVPSTGEAREARLVFPGGIGEKEVFWEVAYQRMPPGMAGDFGVDSKADEVIVAEGSLPAEKGISKKSGSSK